MPLFLIETPIADPTQSHLIRDAVFEAATAAGAELVETRTTTTKDRLFLVFEHDDEAFLRDTIRLADPKSEVSQVRLVGATVEQVRRSGGGNFLTEWDFPEELTMEVYLARKAEKSPLYEQIPEVDFKRTYVREDMGKCLCFYDAGCEEDVILARKKVETPVSRITELE